jgi:GTP-binding protein
MPGFGYASIGKSHREKWAVLNNHYLENRDALKLVCILVDSRHDPMPTDLSLIESLENIGKKYLIILTKCDKLSSRAIQERKSQLESIVSNCQFILEVLPYSSETGVGRNELIGIIKSNLI